MVIQTVKIGGRTLTTLGLAEHVNIDEGQTGENMDTTSLFRLNSTTVDVDNRIRNNSCIKIQHVHTGGYLSTKSNSTWNIEDATGHAGKLEEGGGDKFEGTDGIRRNKGKETQIFHPLDDDELFNCESFIIELSEKASNEDAFLIIPAEPDEV
jgi:hypothetical protein